MKATICQKIDGREYEFEGLEGLSQLEQKARKEIELHAKEKSHWKRVLKWINEFKGVKEEDNEVKGNEQ